MPLPPPNPPAVNTPLPPQPQDPATLVDISNAITYNKQVLVSYEAGVATKDHVRVGAVYEAALVVQNASGGIVSLSLAAGLAAGLAPLTHIAHITHNLLAGDGCSHSFEVVPFLNGTLLTDPQHNLPLVDVGVINALTGPQATAYLVGYGQPVPNLVADCQKAICVVVGCTAEM
ncbi:hypothetical protein L208DRAFT_1236355 [Tricholoma matsutake]|nr:hypothetical protein L208DRAFT_1236355 [Tricholoma matsutake 945]